MAVELIDGFYCYTPTYGYLGRTNTQNPDQINQYQKNNAINIKTFFTARGWSVNAVAGVLGNMMLQSNGLNPACLQSRVGRFDYLPPNSAIINKTDGGVGLVQWDGANADGQQKLVAYCNRNGWNWYSGLAQLYRIEAERTSDIQFRHYTYHGKAWSWANFYNSTDDPAELARVWDFCYEISSGEARQTRASNATWWYNFLQGAGGIVPPWLLFEIKKRNEGVI